MLLTLLLLLLLQADPVGPRALRASELVVEGGHSTTNGGPPGLNGAPGGHATLNGGPKALNGGHTTVFDTGGDITRIYYIYRK